MKVEELVILALTAVIALTTIVYTFVTYKLWRTTRDSLEAVKQATFGTTLQAIAANHREIAFRALASEKLQRAFMSPNPPDENLDSETRLFAGVLINHLETLYEHTRFRTIPDEFKGPLLEDIKKTMRRIPALQKRWAEMAPHVEPQFSAFITKALQEAK